MTHLHKIVRTAIAILCLTALTSAHATGTNAPKEKEEAPKKQWVVFYIKPENAILHVDTMTYMVHDGKKMLQLPVKEYPVTVESPFFKEWKDTITLQESERSNVNVELQPIYSYVTVTTPLEEAIILVDGDSIGQKTATSHRIVAGRHKVIVSVNGVCYYEGDFDIGTAEKKVVNVKKEDLHPIVTFGTLNVGCNEPDADVLVNNAFMGKTPLTLSTLRIDYNYSVTVRKEGFKDDTKHIRLQRGKTAELLFELKNK